MRKLINRKNFLRVNVVTLVSVFILILVGSIVRVSGSGMGCPDWPKCFGEYIPPTSAEQLPNNYQEVYLEQRLQKNERLATIFEKLGYGSIGKKITTDPSILVEQEFNATKTWIEYINRLIGVLIGFFVVLNMVFSFSFRSYSILIPIAGVSVFILTGFQGWVGSLVVSTNLLHGFITFHMLTAVLIVAILLWMNVLAKQRSTYAHKQLFIISVLTLLLFIPQLVLGTEVRGTVDELMTSEMSKGLWTDQLSSNFLIHRSYSWMILMGSIMLFYFARKAKVQWVLNATSGLLGMVLFIMILGIGMTRFSFPVWMQPLHLILAVGIFSMLFYLTLRLKLKK